MSYDGVVRDEWVDANRHMNLAYYVVLFDAATDMLFDRLGIGDDYRLAASAALFAVETHTIYQHEVCAGEAVRIDARMLGMAGKRVHVAHEMFASDGQCAAMQEIMFVHVELSTRRSCPLPPPIVEAHAGRAAPAPAWVGRRLIF